MLCRWFARPSWWKRASFTKPSALTNGASQGNTMEGLGDMGMKWERCGAFGFECISVNIVCVWNCVNVILCEIWWRSWNDLLKDTGIEKMIWVIRFTYGSFLFIVQDESNLHCLVLTLNGAFKRLTLHSSWNRWVEMGFPTGLGTYSLLIIQPERIPWNGDTWSQHDNLITAWRPWLRQILLGFSVVFLHLPISLLLRLEWSHLRFDNVDCWEKPPGWCI